MIFEWRFNIASIATYRAYVHQVLTASAGDRIIKKRLLDLIFIVYISGIPETRAFCYIFGCYDIIFAFILSHANIFKTVQVYDTHSLQQHCLVHTQNTDSGKLFPGCELKLQEQILHLPDHSIQKYHTLCHLKINRIHNT
jgi:hypothetical protein